MTRERAEQFAERARRFGYGAEVVFDPDEGDWYVKIADIVLSHGADASVTVRQDTVKEKV